MRYLTSSFLIVFVVNISVAQTRFNNRVNFGFPAQYITSVVATDSCYYVTGTGVLSVSPYKEGIFFAIMDLFGEVNSIKTYDSFPGKSIEYANNKMFFSKGYFYCSAYFIYSDQIRKPALIKFNTNGDTVFIREYPSELGYETWHNALDGIRSQDGNFYLTCNIFNQTTQNYNADIIKIDSTGKQIWSRIPLPNVPDNLLHLASSLVELNDGSIILSTKLIQFAGVHSNFVRRNQIIKIDTGGNLLNYWTSPVGELWVGDHNDILQTQDGGIVFTMARATEEFDDSLASWHYLNRYGGICKLSNDLSEQWMVTYDDKNPYEMNHYLNRVIELDDGSLVAAGKHFESYQPDSVYLEDYELWDYWNYNGWLVKFSAEGDSIWSRQYHYVISPMDEHFITDIEETEDGGFIMCGQAGDMFHKPPPGQQGWLLKTDEYGCIVPGCQVSVEEREIEDNYLNIYPNPAKDYLNIFLQRKNNDPVKDAKGRLIDLNGNILIEFSMLQSDLTYILPVDIYPSGMYIFQYIHHNEIISSQKVLIVK